jgi:hypothetical protein
MGHACAADDERFLGIDYCGRQTMQSQRAGRRPNPYIRAADGFKAVMSRAVSAFDEGWYSWVGSNHRPPVPQTGALTN